MAETTSSVNIQDIPERYQPYRDLLLKSAYALVYTPEQLAQLGSGTGANPNLITTQPAPTPTTQPTTQPPPTTTPIVDTTTRTPPPTSNVTNNVFTPTVEQPDLSQPMTTQPVTRQPVTSNLPATGLTPINVQGIGSISQDVNDDLQPVEQRIAEEDAIRRGAARMAGGGDTSRLALSAADLERLADVTLGAGGTPLGGSYPIINYQPPSFPSTISTGTRTPPTPTPPAVTPPSTAGPGGIITTPDGRTVRTPDPNVTLRPPVGGVVPGSGGVPVTGTPPTGTPPSGTPPPTGGPDPRAPGGGQQTIPPARQSMFTNGATGIGAIQAQQQGFNPNQYLGADQANALAQRLGAEAITTRNEGNGPAPQNTLDLGGQAQLNAGLVNDINTRFKDDEGQRQLRLQGLRDEIRSLGGTVNFAKGGVIRAADGLPPTGGANDNLYSTQGVPPTRFNASNAPTSGVTQPNPFSATSNTTTNSNPFSAMAGTDTQSGDGSNIFTTGSTFAGMNPYQAYGGQRVIGNGWDFGTSDMLGNATLSDPTRQSIQGFQRLPSYFDSNGEINAGRTSTGEATTNFGIANDTFDTAGRLALGASQNSEVLSGMAPLRSTFQDTMKYISENPSAFQAGDISLGQLTAPQLDLPMGVSPSQLMSYQMAGPDQIQSSNVNTSMVQASPLNYFQAQAPGSVNAQGYGANQINGNYNAQNVGDVNGPTYNASTVNGNYNISTDTLAPWLRGAQMGGADLVRGEGYRAANIAGGQQMRGQTYDPSASVIGQQVRGQTYDPYTQARADQVGNVGNMTTNAFTDQGIASQYMNPYMQNVADIQRQKAQQTYDENRAQRQQAAVRAGAFGGNRQAVQDALAERELTRQQAEIEANSANTAYLTGMQQFNTDRGASQQAQQFNIGNRLQSQLANQAANLNVNSANQAAMNNAGQFNAGNLQQAALSNQGVNLQAQLANQGAMNQAGQFNAGNMQQAGLANQQVGLQERLSNQQAQNTARQFGAGNRQQANLANQGAGIQVGGQNLQAQLATNQLGANTGLQALLANQQTGVNLAGMNQNALNQAGQFNATQGLNANLANQANQRALSLANQQAGLNIAGLNQGALNQAGQFNAQLGMQGQLANQANQRDINLANLQANMGIQGQEATLSQQAQQLNQNAALQAGMSNQQYGMQAALANQNARQQANQFNTQAALGVQELGANQALQAQLANQQAGLTAGQSNLQAALSTQQLGRTTNLTAAQANQQTRLAQNQALLDAQARADQLQQQASQGNFSNQLGAIGQQTNSALAANQIGQSRADLQRLAQAMDIQRLQQLQQAGAGIDQRTQNNLDLGYQDFINQRNYPYQQLNWLQGILSGTPMGFNQEQVLFNRTNPYSQYAGLATAGLGALTQQKS